MTERTAAQYREDAAMARARHNDIVAKALDERAAELENLDPHPLAQMRREFPEYPFDSLPVIPAHWSDMSWHNDASPFFVASPVAGVFIAEATPAEREMTDSARFHVMPLVDSQHVPDGAALYSGDDWRAVLVAMIARQFAEELRASLGPDRFAEVQRRNASAAAGVCHSHDFCDANLVMADAFESIIGRAPLGAEDGSAEHESDCRLWSDAWRAAMPMIAETDAPASQGCRTCSEAIETRVGPCDECGALDEDDELESHCRMGHHQDTGRGVCADCGEFLDTYS